jgi:hypothetical protein
VTLLSRFKSGRPDLDLRHLQAFTAGGSVPASAVLLPAFAVTGSERKAGVRGTMGRRLKCPLNAAFAGPSWRAAAASLPDPCLNSSPGSLAAAWLH